MQTAVDFLSDLEEFQSLLSTHNSKVESYYELLEALLMKKTQSGYMFRKFD